MNDEVFALATQLVSPSYVAQAQQARRARETKFKSLLAQRRLPDNGWDEGTLRLLLEELALMDSNAFIGNAGVGEREARIACPLVRSRHFGFGHGIGRSGDIAEEQPKAAGSSLLYKLTNFLAADAIKRAGALSVNVNCLVLPVATGMTVTLTMLALRAMRPAAKYVVWPRIDQKSCLKAVAAAGCTPLVVESCLKATSCARTWRACARASRRWEPNTFSVCSRLLHASRREASTSCSSWVGSAPRWACRTLRTMRTVCSARNA